MPRIFAGCEVLDESELCKDEFLPRALITKSKLMMVQLEHQDSNLQRFGNLNEYYLFLPYGDRQYILASLVPRGVSIVNWKNKALEAINPVLAQHRQSCKDGTMTRAQLRKELNKVYPFGARYNHPYKVWCKCVNEALEDAFGVEQEEIETLPLWD